MTDHRLVPGPRAMAGAVAVGALGAWGSAVAADDERLAGLAPADQAIAREMTAFIARMEDRHFERIGALNGGATFEVLEHSTDDTDYLVRVTRGTVVEKAGTMVAIGKKAQPGRIPGTLLWSRFYSLDVHPKSPRAGMLHATVVVQFYDGGRSYAGGWLGVMNGTRVEEDMAALRAVTDTHFTGHGRDPAVYRQLMVKGTDDTVSQFRRRPDDSGVSFYGPPVFPGDTARSYRFIAELFERFVDTYLDGVAKRAVEPFTPADVAAQDAMRRRWLVDQFLSDPFSSKLVPFEVWSAANVPPVVRF